MKKGELVIFSSNGKPNIGKFVNYDFQRKLIIIGKNQNRKTRSQKDVISLLEVFKKYKPILEAMEALDD